MEFLSEEWCDRVVARCGDAPAVLRDCVVEIQLTGAPRGRGRITIVVDAGRVTSCVPERTPDAELRLKSTWDDAVAMIRGDRDPNVAFMTGDLKTEGPTGPLLDLLSAWGRPGAGAARAELAALLDRPGGGSA